MSEPASEVPTPETSTSFRCTTSARDRGDPKIGTAPPQRRWLLVEHPGPWPVTAPFGAGLPNRLLRELGHPGVRVLLIRRPVGRGEPRTDEPDTEAARWFVAEPEGTVRAGVWREPDDLRGALDPAAGSPYAGPPLMLVCAHGVHDVCCAVRGRPVAAALRGRWPEQVWECSHVGGDRFAANVLLFPDAVCLGDLDDDTAVAVVQDHLDGRLAVDHLRGFLGMPPPVQVAVHAVHARFGPTRFDAATGTVEAQADDIVTVRVTAASPLPAVTLVTLRSSRAEAQRLTCRAPRETSALTFEVVALDVSIA